VKKRGAAREEVLIIAILIVALSIHDPLIVVVDIVTLAVAVRPSHQPLRINPKPYLPVEMASIHLPRQGRQERKTAMVADLIRVDHEVANDRSVTRNVIVRIVDVIEMTRPRVGVVPSLSLVAIIAAVVVAAEQHAVRGTLEIVEFVIAAAIRTEIAIGTESETGITRIVKIGTKIEAKETENEKRKRKRKRNVGKKNIVPKTRHVTKTEIVLATRTGTRRESAVIGIEIGIGIGIVTENAKRMATRRESEIAITTKRTRVAAIAVSETTNAIVNITVERTRNAVAMLSASRTMMVTTSAKRNAPSMTEIQLVSSSHPLLHPRLPRRRDGRRMTSTVTVDAKVSYDVGRLFGTRSIAMSVSI
jgi:hypothetical protein